MPKKKETQVEKYRVTNRLISWVGEDGKEVEAEEGGVVSSLPPDALKWFLSEGCVVEVDKEEGGHSDDSTNAH
jgi:hypothetical protein